MLPSIRNRVAELIGAPRRIRLRQINGYAPTRDTSTADYRYWDRARRAKARGLEISGLLLKPLGSKVAAWTLGSPPNWIMGSPVGAQRAAPDMSSEALNGWWAAHHADILRAYEEAIHLGDCYLVVNADLSVTVVPPHVVDPLLDGEGNVAGWRITESTEYRAPSTEKNASLNPHTSNTSGVYSPLPEVGEGLGVGSLTIIDDYTATTRTRRIMRGGVTLRTERYPNLIGRVPVIHIANRVGADEFYGRPEGDALIPALQAYGDLIEAAVRGSIRQGRPTPVIERMGTADQVRRFWEQFGRRESHTLPDGSTESVDVIDFDPDQLLTLGGEAQFRYAAPGSFSGDTQTLLSILFSLILEHAEIPEAVWGASIPSSRASAETQMQPFVKWIEKKRGLAEGWLVEVARVALAYLALIDWRIDPDAPLAVGWRPLTEDDGRLRLDTISWAHEAGIIGGEAARQALGI